MNDVTVNLRTKFLLDQIKRKFNKRPLKQPLKEMDDLNKKNILIVAPHADDEVIGCGGLIQKSVSEDSTILVLFVTIEDDRSIVKPTYSFGENVRIIESNKAKKILKYSESSYLRIPERSIENNQSAINLIKNNIVSLIEEYKLNTIFLPNYFDMNPDHRIISKIGLQSLTDYFSSSSSSNLNAIYLYEIWGPVNATHYCNLSQEYFEKKIASMKCYHTQLNSVNYINIINEIHMLRASEFSNTYSHSHMAMKNCLKEFFEFIDPSTIPDYIKKLSPI